MNERRPFRIDTRRAAVFGSALAILICLFGHLGAIGLVGPDEPRYAWIARAMAQTGDWVTPRLYGQPWFEKPVLYYWAAGLGFMLRLPVEWAARLPSAISALTAALAIGWLGWKFYDDGRSFETSPALLAPLIFSTSVGAIGFARAAAPDMLFSALLALAMASAAFIFRRSGALRSAESSDTETAASPWRFLPLVFFGVFLGLAVLAKGPAAVVLAGGAVALWASGTKQWRVAFHLLHPMAIVPFCLVALPWYVICARRNPEFLNVFLWQHNFERYLTPLFQHRQPFWYFGPIILAALLPWIALLWPATQEGLQLWRKKSWRNSPGFFFACWATFPVVFFSFSQSKLPGYVLPAVAPLALLCSVSAWRMNKRNNGAVTGIALGGTWGVLLIAVLIVGHRIPWEQQTIGEHGSLFIIICAGAAVMIGALGIALLASRKKFGMAVVLCAIVASLSVEIANLGVVPALDSYSSARSYFLLLRNNAHPDRIFTYETPRASNYGLAFYFQRELPEWSPSDPGPGLVLTTRTGFASIRGMGRFRGEIEDKPGSLLLVPIYPSPHPTEQR